MTYTERSLRGHKDWDKIEAAMTHDRLARNPEQQAEAVAHHYTRLAALSMNLLELVNIRRQYPLRYGGELTDKAIETLMEAIREAHLKDLGIPLEWKTDDTVYHNG